jgi:hypothetical protein
MKAFLVGAGCAMAIGMAVSASAQTAPRAYVQGAAGPSFGTESSSVFAGGIGMALGRSFQITAEIGQMRNVLPKALQSEANALADELRADTGSIVTVDARARAIYATGGLRWLVPSHGAVHPFLGLTAGIARVTPRALATVDGISVGIEADSTLTKPLVGGGGGFTVDVGQRLAVELGYHYNRIFTDSPSINTSRIMGAFLVKF